MNNKKNSIPLVILICILLLAGLIFMGDGLGKLIGRQSESVIISIGLGLIVVATFLTKVFMRDET